MQSVDESYSIWHPFSQMKGTTELPKVVKAQDVWLHTEDGKKIFDAISSWWVNLHGHSHPYIAQKVHEQMLQLEHVIFAGFTHDPAIELSKRLLNHLPQGEWKFFFSDNGSTAIEVALKMAIQYFRREDMTRKVKVIALDGSYHGDTFGAMAAAERSVFTDPWDDMFFEAIHIPAPTPGSEQACFDAIEANATDTTVFFYEPMVQGAGGMRMYSKEAMQEMLHRLKNKGAILVADEVMTGFGRLGSWFASDQCEQKPDMIALSKGLTGGALPMSLTVCDQRFYDAFLHDEFAKGFLHGHSFTGNPIGCAAALASLDLMEKEETWQKIKAIEQCYRDHVEELSSHPMIHNVRITGTVLAFDIKESNQGYIHPLRDRLYKAFLDKGVLLRPLGNVVYLLPPYSTPIELIEDTIQKILETLNEL